MFKIDKNIQALLYQYDCVVIPEFGGFVANYKPSQIKKETQFIYPPSKVLSFNKNLRTNDGLLAKHISEENSITFEEANQSIKEIVEDYFTQLNNGHRIEFEKVGILYFDIHKNILFDPFNNCNFLLDSFGMEAFFAPKSKRTKKINEIKELFVKEEAKVFSMTEKKPIQTEVLKNEKIVPNQNYPLEIQKKLNWKKFAVAAVSISFVAYSGIIAYKTDFRNPKYISSAELNPFKPSLKHKYFSRKNNILNDEKENLLAEDSSSISLAGLLFDTISESIPSKNLDENSKIDATKLNKTSSIRDNMYYVVGGCFSNFENAKNYYSTLEKKGFGAKILERHNGLYPVVYGSYSTKKEAISVQLQILKTDTNKAWILKR